MTAVRAGATRERAGRGRAVAWRGVLLRWTVLATAVGIWELAARAHGSVYFPPPGRIARG